MTASHHLIFWASICLLGLTTSAAAKEYPLQDTPKSAGGGTVKQFDHNAYSLPLDNQSMTKRLDFSVGNSFFRNPWVEAPASTEARDGLGPLFNTNSCQGCHIKDGRGHPPAPGETPVSLFLRLSVPAAPKEDAELLERQGVKPAPVYGTQLQNAALPGVEPEANMVVDYIERNMSLEDGATVSLRVPEYRIENSNYGPLPDDLLTSPRVAPPMIGLGLLEAISEEDLLVNADPEDANGDGISGRPNNAWNRATNTLQMGRFGWKAGEVSIKQQSLGAFAGDMGLTSSLNLATDCDPKQRCDETPHGGEPEVSDKIANFITFYASSLAVPARRDMDDPAVQAGARKFNDLGCAGCHTPRHQTAEVEGRPELSDQAIWPYTDMLLHDMGEELADGRPEFKASGQEWRTPPLWGVGLAQTVNPRAGFLHDGRARTLEEAILWHGGEAKSAKEQYRHLPAEERETLLRFLESL
ncbi:di-heme oxidoredictase family protein [Halomonas sp. M20]|uniref:di-heme oxidoreductase family protein n=1 Tax=Halomonas sp. M20 TaxID=2763264 RepID=UPI001D0AB9E5|nr:di-heme oxidoredictase family protein [Halomonas sp. M20]